MTNRLIEERLVLPDGQHCAVSVAGEGPDVLLIHGGGSRASNFAEVQTLLSDRFRVIAPDLRGFGGSQVPPGSIISHEIWLADMVAVLDHFGVERAHVSGWSLGATVALNLASRHSARVASLALLGAPHPDRPINRAFFRERLALLQATDNPAEVVDALFPTIEGMFSPATRALRPGAMSQVREEQIANAPSAAEVTQAYESRPDFAEILPGIGCPATLIVGEDDRTCDMDGARVLASKLPDPRIVTIADCGHYYAVEQPEAVAAALAEAFTRA